LRFCRGDSRKRLELESIASTRSVETEIDGGGEVEVAGVKQISREVEKQLSMMEAFWGKKETGRKFRTVDEVDALQFSAFFFLFSSVFFFLFSLFSSYGGELKIEIGNWFISHLTIPMSNQTRELFPFPFSLCLFLFSLFSKVF